MCAKSQPVSCKYWGKLVPEDFTGCAKCDLSQACEIAFECGDAPHPFGCICDAPQACVACTPEPDHDALDFARMVRQGMSEREAAEVKDVESMTFEQWQAAYVDAL